MRRKGVVSVAEISAAVRLSKTTAKKIVDRLASRGLVCSAGKGLSTEEGESGRSFSGSTLPSAS